MHEISLVLPSFNSDKYLCDVIESFLAQDYPKKKLFIIDGKSTDQSHNIIRSYISKYSNIVWITQRDDGISDAINISLDYLDDGGIWGYLGADDILLPRVFSRVNEIFKAIRFVDALYFDSYSYHPQKNKIHLRSCPEFTKYNLLSLGTVVGLQNFFIRSEIIKKFRFDNTLKYAMDFDLYLRLLKADCFSFLHVPQASTLNIQDGNISNIWSVIAETESLVSARKVYGLSFVIFTRYIRHILRKTFQNVRMKIGIT